MITFPGTPTPTQCHRNQPWESKDSEFATALGTKAPALAVGSQSRQGRRPGSLSCPLAVGGCIVRLLEVEGEGRLAVGPPCLSTKQKGL